jgi:superfamily II DNA or RNA helicase
MIKKIIIITYIIIMIDKNNLNNENENIIKNMKVDYSYPEHTDLELQNKLYKKREFYYHKIPNRKILTDYNEIKNFRDKKCGSKFQIRTQQYLLSNFINPDTPFKGLLMFHGAGTGKTCAAITIAENFKEQVRKYGTKIYVLVPGPLIRENWRDEIIQCTKETYLKDINTTSGFINEYEYNKLLKQAKYLTQQYYKIISYKSFYKKVLGQKISDKKIDDKKIKKIYKKTSEGEFQREIAINKIDSLDNTLLIIDEAHHITDNEYGNALRKIISNSKNLKILLLTATPMINFADEIVELLNYIRPIDDQISRDKIFTSDKSHIMAIKEGGKEYLQKMANGYVSHYRGLDPLTFAKQVDMGDIPDKLLFTKLIRCKMLKFQLDTYLNVIQNYNDSLDRKSQAVSNFCFPCLSDDKKSIKGYAGKEGLNILKGQLKSNKQLLQKLINNTYFDGKLDNNEIITDLDKNKTITGLILKKENLKHFSIKFYNTLDNIEKLVNKNAGTAFLYFNLVKVGVNLFTEVLNMNGYLEYNENRNYIIKKDTIDALTGLTYKDYNDKNLPIDNFYPATYLIMTGKDDDRAEQTPELNKKILDSVFNKVSNKDGRYLKLVLGSKVMSEGVTLENIAEVHIMDVYFNLSIVYQVIGRALRDCKHYKITNDKNPYPEVRIYRYVVSIDNELTTEEQMYKKAELKYILIKDTERMLKEIALDCPINYNGNLFPEEIEKYKNCSSVKQLMNMNIEERKNINMCPTQCDFQSCLFKCFDDKLNLKYYNSTTGLYKKITKDKLDYSTFTHTLARNEINSIKDKIKELYKFRYVYTLEECINSIKKSYLGEKKDLFEEFFVYKGLDELIPITENEFNNFIDTIYDKFNIPGYLIYRNKFYIFQPFDKNEDLPMYYRTTFHSNLFNSLSIYNYLKTTDILSMINDDYKENIKSKTSYSITYNFKDTIEYYDSKIEYKYVGIVDKSTLKKRIVNQNIPDVFKLRTKREKILVKKRGAGIPTTTGAVCENAKKKKELIDIANRLNIDLRKDDSYDSRLGLCELIKYRLLYLEKYSTNDDKNKYTYFIIPINHPIYPFPFNLEDRIQYILEQIDTKIPIKYKHTIIKTNNGIFENQRDVNLTKYILNIENSKDLNKYEKILKSFLFQLDNDKWSIIIE